MPEKLMTPADTLEIAEEALRFYWRILLGHVDEMENLYRTGTISPKTVPDAQRLGAAVDSLKKELFGMGAGEAFALRDPRAPETARKAYAAMLRMQELQAGGGGEATPRAPAVPPAVKPAAGFKTEVAIRLEFLRSHHGLTITGMAQVLGIRRETVSYWLNGHKQPGDDMKDLIIREFSLPVDFFRAQYPDGKYPAGMLRGKIGERTGQNAPVAPFAAVRGGQAVPGDNGRQPRVAARKEKDGNKKMLRALKTIGIDCTGSDLSLVRTALAEASSMVGAPIDRTIFDEYCLQGKPGPEVGKKHGRKPYQLSVDIYRQAMRIRKNRQAMMILRAAVKGNREEMKTVTGVLLGLGYPQGEAGRLAESLAAFNIKTVDDLRQAISEGDLEAIPGIGKDRAKTIETRLAV